MMSERKPIDILRHEAGHMIVAKVLGFETLELSYNESQAGANLTVDPKLPDVNAVSAFIRRRATVLYAGVLAESLKGAKVDNEEALELIRGPTASDDYSKVRELVRVLAGIERGEIKYQDVLDRVDGEVWNKAAELVEKYAPQIVMLSKHWREMLGGRSTIEISADEIRAIECFEQIRVGCELEQV
jgi:hypothetical protein